MKKEYKLVLVLSICGVVMILLGMSIWINSLFNECNELERELIKKEIENIKLYQENDALWENYYSNVSDYKE